MITLLLESHAASTDNERGIASGHQDVALSRRGRREARMLGRRYAGRQVDVVYCSDLRRARDTAAIAFESGRPVLIDARLREWDYGAFAGRPRAEIASERLRRVHDPFPGGESLEQVVERMRLFLEDVATRHWGETVLIVGHNATRYALEHWIHGTPLVDVVTNAETYEPGRAYTFTDDTLRRTMAGGPRGESNSDWSVRRT